MFQHLTNTIVVTGHYGSGKTNFSINLAIFLREQGRAVTLADLDVVNPYFRSADFQSVAQEKGIELIAPAYANSSVDIPALTGALDARLHHERTVIIDVGGDDDGAYALGRYAPRIKEQPYNMLFVANFFRYLTKTPSEAAAYLGEIEVASRLEATQLVNNSNLGGETTWEDVEASRQKAEELSRLTGFPLLCTAANRELVPVNREEANIFPVKVYVKAPWQNSDVP